MVSIVMLLPGHDTGKLNRICHPDRSGVEWRDLVFPRTRFTLPIASQQITNCQHSSPSSQSAAPTQRPAALPPPPTPHNPSSDKTERPSASPPSPTAEIPPPPPPSRKRRE